MWNIFSSSIKLYTRLRLSDDGRDRFFGRGLSRVRLGFVCLSRFLFQVLLRDVIVLVMRESALSVYGACGIGWRDRETLMSSVVSISSRA